MAEPISFPSTTNNTQLPLLFTGQAQKEFFLNRSFAILDALALQSIEAVQDEPPTDPADGACYLVGSSPTGEWAGHSDQLALRVSNSWHYIAPAEGLEIYDRAVQSKRIYASGWTTATAPGVPIGGTVIDLEARAVIAELISILQAIGILGDPA